jgi:hypothetical protein
MGVMVNMGMYYQCRLEMERVFCIVSQAGLYRSICSIIHTTTKPLLILNVEVYMYPVTLIQGG